MPTVSTDGALFTRGGHSNRLCTNTRDRGQERGQAVKAENLEGKRSKVHGKLEKFKGQAQLRSTGNQISSKHDTTSCRASSVNGQRTI